ncbi:MAG: hypothetical protein ACP5D2_02115 [Candidatus Nanoarchaeia archaeon]
MNKKQNLENIIKGFCSILLEGLVMETIDQEMKDDLLILNLILSLNLNPEEARLNLEEQGFIKKINKTTYKRIKR